MSYINIYFSMRGKGGQVDCRISLEGFHTWGKLGRYPNTYYALSFTDRFLFIAILLLSSFTHCFKLYYCCTGGTLWHLQKFL
jgi:hypothetical protein